MLPNLHGWKESGAIKWAETQAQGEGETEQDHWSLPPAPPTLSSAWLWPVENFNQKISLIRKMRNAETKKNIQRRLNNDSL